VINSQKTNRPQDVAPFSLLFLKKAMKMKGFFNSFKKAAAGIITGSNYSQETN